MPDFWIKAFILFQDHDTLICGVYHGKTMTGMICRVYHDRTTTGMMFRVYHDRTTTGMICRVYHDRTTKGKVYHLHHGRISPGNRRFCMTACSKSTIVCTILTVVVKGSIFLSTEKLQQTTRYTEHTKMPQILLHS